MDKLFTITILLLTLNSFGQKNKFTPFKLIIIKPDTAIIEKQFYSDIDSVQSDHIIKYYHSIQLLEVLMNDTSVSNNPILKEGKEEAKNEFIRLKSLEPEIKQFKYFETLSSYSLVTYNFYFNEYEPYSTIIEVPTRKTSMELLNKLADSSKADYILFFNNIHTAIRNGRPILKLTTSLYSLKENKIILTKETVGDTESRGDIWTCGNTNLSCLLINGVRTSTAEIAPVIAKRQIRM